MRYRLFHAVVAAVPFVLAGPVAGQQPDSLAFAPSRASDLVWSSIQPAGFDAGAEIATVHGDPAVAGKAYTIRLRFPDGYRFPPHWHTQAESVTVLEGTLLLAKGDKADESRLQRYEVGDYLFIEAKHPHYGGATGPTVMQLHGSGPFEIIVVGSEQDMR